MKATLLLWCLLLALALWVPGLDRTRYTIRVSLLFYAAAVLVMLLQERNWLARCCWTLAWLAYLIHLGMAFHHYHAWSHANALEHTRAVSGVGEGIYVSHFFTLCWTLDVLYWWLRPSAYAARSVWIDRLLHGFMAFMVFNGTVVYEQGFIRWFGVALFAVLTPLVLWRLCGFRPSRQGVMS